MRPLKAQYVITNMTATIKIMHKSDFLRKPLLFSLAEHTLRVVPTFFKAASLAKLRFAGCLLILAFSLVLLFATEVLAHDHPPFKDPPRQITVTGKSSLQVPPDKATVRFAIVTKDKKAEKARETNELTAKDVLNSVRELGISDQHMQLESLNINEEQQYNPKTQSYEPDGYKASRSFVVELRDLDKLAGVIAAVISHGSNDLSGVEYGLKDPTALRIQALKEATANAARKADLMLEPVGEKRGPVLSIEEVSDRFIGYPEAAGFKRAGVMTMAADASAPVAEEDSFAQGHIEVEASVKAVFSIGESKPDQLGN